jgi:hypothetical protein
MYASKVVALAQSWIGNKESNGTHKFIIDIYNSHKPHPRGYKMTYNDPWCATFVSAVAIKLGYTKIMPVECSCSKMIELYQKLGSWVEADNRVPVPGDIVFYDWDDNGVGDNKNGPDHVGIVEKVVNNKITVIEGNYSNAVRRRCIDVNGRYIRGYAVPKYTAEQKKTTTAKKSIDAIAKEVIDGKWGNGDARKTALTKAGYDYAKVQARVNELVKKVYVPKTIVKGDKVTLKNAPLYKDATTSKVSKNISGNYYIYDGEKINGRYRITNKATSCGKKPIWLYVTGFVKI